MPTFVNDPVNLTKEELKLALKKVDVDLPPGNIKKETLVALYKEEVLLTTPKTRAQKSEFSSDEDIPEDILSVEPTKKTKNSPKKISKEHSEETAVNGAMTPTVISQLTDAELAHQLRELGFSPGPIVTSTRRVYERKLVALMNTGAMGDASTNGYDEQDDYSDEDDEEAMEMEDIIEEVPPVRQRVPQKQDSPRKLPTRVAADRYEPKSSEVHSAPASSQVKTVNKSGMSIWLKLIMFLVLGGLLYLVYINMDSLTAKNIPRIKN